MPANISSDFSSGAWLCSNTWRIDEPCDTSSGWASSFFPKLCSNLGCSGSNGGGLAFVAYSLVVNTAEGSRKTSSLGRLLVNWWREWAFCRVAEAALCADLEDGAFFKLFKSDRVAVERSILKLEVEVILSWEALPAMLDWMVMGWLGSTAEEL